MKSKIKQHIKISYKTLKMFLYSILLGKNLLFRGIYFASLPWIVRGHKLQLLGDNIFVGARCHVGVNVVIKSHVLIAANVSFVGNDHIYNKCGMSMFDCGKKTVEQIIFVDNDVWIGHGVILVGGVKLGEGSIIAAGSVVIKNVDPYTIVGGNPARFIKNRFNPDELERHKQIKRY